MIDIRDLRKDKAEVITAIEAVRAKATAEENRNLTEAEDKELDRLLLRAEQLGAMITREERIDALKAAESKPVAPPIEVKDNEPPEATIGGYIRSLVRAKTEHLSLRELSDLARKDGRLRLSKALAASTSSAGGILIPEDLQTDLLPALRAASVVRRATPRTIPMPNGNLVLPGIATGSTATYGGENANIATTEPTLAPVNLSAKKLTAIVPISNNLLRYQSLGGDAWIRDDMVAGVSLAEDAAFLRGNGLTYNPKGLRYWAASGNITAMTATPTFLTASTDLSALIEALDGHNVPVIRRAWFMASRTSTWLKFLRTTDGPLAFPEYGASGLLMGYPVYVTNSIPTTGGTGSDSEIILAEMSMCVIGEAAGLMIDVSTEAAYYDGSAVQAAFSKDQTVIRVIEEHDFAVRNSYAVSVKTGVTWGS